MKDLKHLQRIIENLQADKNKGKLGDYAQGRLAAFKMAEELIKNLTIQPISNSLPLAYEAIKKVKDMYPTDIFPKDGENLDCKSAEMARVTCDNIKRELDEMVKGNDR